MRLLVVGADSRYAIERPYVKYLAENELISEVALFAAQNIFLAYYQKNIFNKIIYRAGCSNILKKINNLLKVEVERYKPDVVFVFKGMEVFPSTLRWMRNKGIKLANYNPDNPFIFSGRGSGNRNITQSIKLFDLFMSYDKGICKKMETEYKVKSKLLPFGFDLPELLFEVCEKLPEIKKACFIGNTDVHRLAFLNELAAGGIALDLYGMNWKKESLHPDITYAGPVFEDELWKALRKYRVQLNLMRIHNPDSHNMRSFEIPGIGGIQLAPETVDHLAYFKKDEEIFIYKDLSSCIGEIKKILALDKEEAGKIRGQARKRSLRDGYTYKARANAVAVYLNEMLKGN